MNQSYLQLPLSNYINIYIYTVQLALFQGSLAKCSWLFFYRRMKIGFLLTSGFTEQWPSQIWSHSVATLWKTWRCSQWQYICSQSIIMSHWYDNFRLAMYRKTAYHAGCKMPILISLNFNCWSSLDQPQLFNQQHQIPLNIFIRTPIFPIYKYIYTLLYTYIWAEAWIMLKYARVKSPWWDSNLPEPLFSVRDVQACHRSPVWKSASNMAIPEVSLRSAQWIHLNGVKLSKSAGELIQPTSVLNLSLIRSITDPQQWRVKILQKKTISQGCQSSHIFFCLPALGSCIHRQYHAVSPRVGPTWNGGQTRYSYEIPTSTWGPLVEWMLAMLSKMDAKKRSSDMRALPNSVIYNVPSKDSRMACLLSFLFTHSKTMLRRLDHTGNNIFTNNGNLTWTEVSHSFQEQYRHLGGAPAYISTNSGGSVDGRKKPICDPRLCRPCHHLSWP